MKSEAQVVEDIRRATMVLDVLLWKNPVGYWPEKHLHYGLDKGSSDLIGIQRMLITPDMVGQYVGVFVAAEVKKEEWRPSMDTPKHHSEQSNFIAQVKSMGGKGGFYQSAEQFKKDMTNEF